MREHVAQMGPMLALAGLLAGRLAEAISRTGGYGFLHDVARGLVGSVIGGTTGWVVVSGDAGRLAMSGIGCGGAALAIVAQRMFWRSARPGP